MKQCWIGILLALLLIFSLTACKDANNAAQPLPTAGSGGKLPEISKTETGDMNRDSSESSAVPDGKPDMIPPSDKEAAAVSVSGSGAEFAMSDLEGSWQMVEGEVEGWRYSAADEGIASTLCFTRIYDSNIPTTDLTADFDRMDENGNEAHERNMEVKFLDELLYYGCPNEAWSVQMLCEEEGVSYFVAITDPDTLELYFSFEKNGNSGASLAYYRRI